MFDQIIDANVNRVAEGLRVIEEYARFVANNESYANQIAGYRYQIHKLFPQSPEHLMIRNTEHDARAKQAPKKRDDIRDVLAANFKRAQEGLRVLEEYSGNADCSNMRYDIYELEKDILLHLLKPKIKNGIYLVSDNIEHIKQGFTEDKVSLIQYRNKNFSKEQYYNVCKELSPLSKKYETPFIINDYIDIAKLLDSDGFHSGQDDISVTDQRIILGPHKLIGRTTHDLDQGKIAEKQGADYVSVGPIWETPSKPGRAAIGFEYLKRAKDELTVPFVAIGGINTDNIDEILACDPPLIGVVRAFEDIDSLSQRLVR